MKMTDWFPMDVLPVRDGVYEIKPPGEVQWFAQFFCGQWLVACANLESALKQTKKSIDCYTPLAKGWRGLVAKGEQS